jgi:hypothetical protein
MEHREDGEPRWTLHSIAAKYEICWESVVKLVKLAGFTPRVKGAHKQQLPSARVMKILRDHSEPGATYAETGIRNPRCVKVNGKIVRVPLSRQRIKQIVDFWTKRRKYKIKRRGFRIGELLYWGPGHMLEVLRYDDETKGAVKDHSTGKIMDPFLWVQKGYKRPKRIKENLPT